MPSAKGARGRFALQAALILAGLLLAGTAFLPHLDNGFILDDHPQIEQNPSLDSEAPWTEPFTRDIWSHMRGRIGSFHSYYRPALYLFYRVVAEVSFTPRSFHAASLLLHVLCATLLALIAIRFGLDRTASIVAALIFTLHPLAGETVFSAADACDQLLLLGTLAGLWAVLGAQGVSGAALALRALGATAGTALALLSKESGLVVAALLSLALASCNGIDRRKSAALLAGPWLATLGYLVARAAVVGSTHTGGLYPDLGWSLARSGLALLWYARFLFVPYPLTPFHPFPLERAERAWDLLGWAAWAGLLIALALVVRHRRVRFWSAWLVLPLLPTLGHFFFVRQVASGVVVAERYAYVSLAAFSLLGTAALRWAWSSLSGRPGMRAVLLALSGALLVAGAFSLRDYGSAFRSDESVLLHALEIDPNSSFALAGLGAIELERGRPSEAVALLSRAVDLEPRAAQYWLNLGVAQLQLGRRPEAISSLAKGVELEPSFASAHSRLAVALRLEGRMEEAGRHFQLAVEWEPDNAGFRLDLGSFFFTTGRLQEARVQWEEALRLEPERVELLYNLGLLRLRLGDAGGGKELLHRFLLAAPPELSDARERALDLVRKP